MKYFVNHITGIVSEEKEFERTIKNVNISSNDLVKKVIEEETTYVKECKNLIGVKNEEDFYKKRDSLIEALNLYEIGSHFKEEEKNNLEYEVFIKEIKELKKKQTIKYLSKWKINAGLCVLVQISMFALACPPLAGLFLGCQIGVATLAAYSNNGEKFGSKGYLKHHTSLKTYTDVVRKSEFTDDFMEDFSELEKSVQINYNDSEIDALYRNNAKGLINHFSGLNDIQEKKRVLNLIYDSKHENKEFISWLDNNEPELIRDAVFEEM